MAPKLLAAARALLDGAANELVKLGPKATAAQQKKALQRCVEALNELDAAEGNFIQSIEAEDLSAAIDSSLPDEAEERRNVADAWRDW